MTQDWILIVDPSQSILDMYRMILERERYLVETSKSLNEALDQLSIRQYSVIITEYLEPFDETCRMIQWVKQGSPGTYIMMVTSLAVDERAYEKLFDSGIDDHILKPCSPKKILVHIKKGLKQREWILEKEELEKQSLLDPMTRCTRQLVFNSTYFKKCLQQEIKKAKRHQHPLSLLLIQIPKRGGPEDLIHHFCTQLLEIVRQSIREEDLLGSNDGVFGIILPETDQVGSQVLVKRLSGLIQSHPTLQTERPLIGDVSFQTFTYPENFAIPDSLSS